jgi:UDP-N-acetylglucosamine diphosphorylase/glucosamine-1-phosphate N-acetyltransferase
MNPNKLAVAIMAAGKGTRMKNPDLAKVMFPVGGVPMIDHVVERAIEFDADPVIAIIGHQRGAVRSHLEGRFGDRIGFAEQVEQLGTGHAVMQALPLLEGFGGDVLVLSGDVPLLTSATIGALIETHRSSGAIATVLTVIMPDPTGYGRVVRNDDGSVAKIVEHKDATESEREITEINSGIYIFRAADLAEALGNLDNNNVQREYYLTDVFGWFRRVGRPVAAYASADAGEVQGINTVEQLADADVEFGRRTSEEAVGGRVGINAKFKSG